MSGKVGNEAEPAHAVASPHQPRAQTKHEDGYDGEDPLHCRAHPKQLFSLVAHSVGTAHTAGVLEEAAGRRAVVTRTAGVAVPIGRAALDRSIRGRRHHTRRTATG